MKQTPRVQRQAIGAHVLLTISDHRWPLVRFGVVRPSGALRDPSGRAGLARLHFELLLRGTATRTRTQFAGALERLGSRIACTVGPHAASIGGVALRRHLEPTLDLLGEALRAPRFAAEEHAALVDELAATLVAMRDDDDELAELFARRALFAGHAAARSPDGEVEQLAAIAVAEICAEHAAGFGHAIVVMAGDLTQGDAQALAAALLRDLPGAQARPAEARVLPPSDPGDAAIWLVDKPDRSQAQLRLLSMGPAGVADDVDAFWLGTVAFGGTFRSPFCQAIREQRGWSYVAHAGFDRRSPWPAPVTLVSAPALDDAIDCLEVEWEMVEALARGQLADEPIVAARAYLLGRQPFALASAHDMVGSAVANELLGLPPERLLQDAARIEALDPESVRAALRRHLGASERRVVMVGPAQRILSELQRRMPSVAVKVIDFRAGLDVCESP